MTLLYLRCVLPVDFVSVNIRALEARFQLFLNLLYNILQGKPVKEAAYA